MVVTTTTTKKKSKILRNTHIGICCKGLDFSLSSNVKLRRVTVSLVWGKIRNLIVGLLVGVVAPFLFACFVSFNIFLNEKIEFSKHIFFQFIFVVFFKGIILHLQKLAKVGFTFFRETICFQKDDDFFFAKK